MKNLKIVQIGSAGHYEYALPALKKYGFDLSAIAPGCEGEFMHRALRDLGKLGYSPVIYNDWKEMIDKETPDVVIINSIMCYNAEMSIYALERGIYVFCEKPVATTFEDLERLKKAYYKANEEKRVCFCGMYGITYTPHFEAARRLIRSGEIGEVRLVTAQKSYRLGRREPFYSSREKLGGMIPWVAIHAIDWIYNLCGFKFKSVYASHSRVANGGNGDLEVSAQMIFEGENGAMATVSSDYFRPAGSPTHDDDRIRVVGTKGIVEVRSGMVYHLCDGEKIIENVMPEHDLFESFCLEISGEGICDCTAEEAFDTTAAALYARSSADERKVFEINL